MKRFDGGIGGEELVCSTVLTISTAKDEPITLKVKAENINIRSRKKVGKEGVEGGGRENYNKGVMAASALSSCMGSTQSSLHGVN